MCLVHLRDCILQPPEVREQARAKRAQQNMARGRKLKGTPIANQEPTSSTVVRTEANALPGSPSASESLAPSSLLVPTLSQGTSYRRDAGMTTGPVTVTITASQRDHTYLLPALQPLLELPNATIILQPQSAGISHLASQANAAVSHNLVATSSQPENNVSLVLCIS
jgi:hypothetical protein